MPSGEDVRKRLEDVGRNEAHAQHDHHGGGDAPGLNAVIHGEDEPRLALANLI